MKLRKEFEGKREKKKQTGEVGVALERLESPAACVWKETDDQQTEKKCAWMMIDVLKEKNFGGAQNM